jgi:hypothetical protein
MTKAEKKRRVSALLARYGLGETVTGEDDAWLRDLITAHPDYPQKFGAGVARFFVDSDGRYGGRSVWFESTCGIVDNFSTGRCIDGMPPLRTRLIRACRAAIDPDLHAFKLARFDGQEWATCEETGEPLHWSDAHVDHIYPLVLLAGAWVDERPHLGIADLAKDRPGAVGDSFADPGISAEFRAHHDEHARLRLVSARVNLSKGAKVKREQS